VFRDAALASSLALAALGEVKPAWIWPQTRWRSNSAPPPRRKQLTFLRELGIEATTSEHAYVRTVAESRDLRGDIAGVHTKNLFLRDAKRRYYLTQPTKR
jgi:hypothetical protein